VPVLDWADGDGVNPFQGPLLVAGGAPTPAQATAWTQEEGTDVTTTDFTTAQSYSSAVNIDPGVNDDYVIAVLTRIKRMDGNYCIFGTRVGATAGILLYTDAVPRLRFANLDTLAAGVTSTGIIEPGNALISCTFDDNGLQSLYFNGDLLDADNVAALGTIGVGSGLGLAARSDGTWSMPGSHSRVLFWTGANIADLAPAAWHEALADYVLGTSAAQGAAGDFARNTSASWQNRNGVWAIASSRLPRAGDADGLRLAPARTNQAFANCDPQAGDAAAALTITGGAVAEVDDAAALLAAGAREWGPNVMEWTNATGVDQYCRMSQQTGDVNARSLQCLARRSAGAGAIDLGLYDESAGTFVAGAAIVDAYAARTLVHGQVPVDVDATLCLRMATATTVRFAAHDMSTGPRCTTPIPNDATGAAHTRASDVFTTTDTPADETGGFGLDVTPMGWSAAETGGASLLGRAGGGNAMLYTTAAGVWELDLDGTTLITSTVGPADGVSQRIDVRWASGGLMTLTIDGVVWSAAYDGTIQNAGAWEFEVDGGEMAIRNFYTVRQGSG
jgi:hypothetical protein